MKHFIFPEHCHRLSLIKNNIIERRVKLMSLVFIAMNQFNDSTFFIYLYLTRQIEFTFVIVMNLFNLTYLD